MTKEEANVIIDCLKEIREKYIEDNGYVRLPLPAWYVLDKAIQVIEQTRWIPVSERLPEKKGLYLVSVKNDHERRYSKTCQYMGKNHWFARQDVEAWMPLPETYKAEGEDK